MPYPPDMPSDAHPAWWDEQLQRSAEIGAKAALARIGLDTPEAVSDLNDFRKVMAMWRELKREALNTFVRWLVMAVLALVVFTVAPKYAYLLKGN